MSTPKEKLYFIYRDHDDNIKIGKFERIAGTSDYRVGCTGDRIIEYVYEPEKINSRLNYHQRFDSQPLPVKRKQPNDKHLAEICFTGFNTKEKQYLMQIARKHNLYICKSVTRNLDFLCCGENAGPVKMAHAEEQGTLCISKEQFIEMLKTGELLS